MDQDKDKISPYIKWTKQYKQFIQEHCWNLTDEKLSQMMNARFTEARGFFSRAKISHKRILLGIIKKPGRGRSEICSNHQFQNVNFRVIKKHNR